MDEDTPVSSVWQSHLALRACGALSRQLVAQAEHVAKADRDYAVWVERERIIALINDKVEDVYGDGVYGPSDLIALIRGDDE